MKNEKLSRLFLRFNGGGPVGYTQGMAGQLPQYQAGADLNGVDMKTRQDFEHYYGGKYPILAEGGDTDMDGDDQSFYTNKVNTFIKGIQETAQKNLLKEIMREAKGETEEKEYSDEEVIQAAYGMNFNRRPDYGNSLYDPGNMKLFADNKIGNVRNAFKKFGEMTALVDYETAQNKKYGIPDTYTDIKSKFRTGMADIFKQKNPVYDNYTYEQMAYGGNLTEYQGDKGASTTANNTGTATNDDKDKGFTTRMINGKLYAIGPDGRLFEAAEGKKEEGVRFDYRNRNRLTPEFAEAMRKGTYLDSKLLGPPIVEEKGWGPFKRNITTWQYGKLSGDPYATNNNGAAPGSTTVPGSTTQKKTTGPDIDPSLLPENNPKVKKATDWNYRPGQDTDYFPPSGGWKDMPAEGPLNLDAPAGPRVAPERYEKSNVKLRDDLTVLGREMAAANLKKGQANAAAYEQMIADAAIRDGYGTGAFMPQIGAQAYGLSKNEFEKYGNAGYDFPFTPVVENGQVTDWRDLTAANAGYPNAYAYDAQGNLSIPLDEAALAQQRVNRDKIYDQVQNGIKFDYTGNVIKKEGGTMLPIFAPGGPFSFTDMAEEEEEGIIYDPTTGKPLEFPSSAPMTDQQRIDVLDKGTEYDKSDDPNTWFVENPFNVKQKSRERKKPSFNKMMRNLGAVKEVFLQDERLANQRKLSEASQASNVFNTAPSFYGNDVVNTGKRKIGDGSGIPVFNTGFAQMGGSMMDSIKEGDEVYLTEEQINDIIKRGGKLSYL